MELSKVAQYKTRQTSGEAGFVIGGLLIAGVIALTLVALTSFFLILKTQQQLKHQCQLDLFKLNLESGRLLNELLALNPKAKFLRVERQLIDAALASPAVLAAAPLLQKRAQIMAEQAALNVKQRALLLRARMNSSGYSKLAKSNAHRAVATARTQIFPQTLPVIAIPTLEIAPEYYPAPAFSTLQKHTLRWEIKIATILGANAGLLKPWTNSMELKGQCSATLEESEDKWTAVVKVDKF